MIFYLQVTDSSEAELSVVVRVVEMFSKKREKYWNEKRAESCSNARQSLPYLAERLEPFGANCPKFFVSPVLYFTSFSISRNGLRLTSHTTPNAIDQMPKMRFGCPSLSVHAAPGGITRLEIRDFVISCKFRNRQTCSCTRGSPGKRRRS